MAFDAGAIVAHLDIDLAKAEAKLKDFEARLDKFGRGRSVRLNVDFDSQAIPKARKFFSDLDKAATADAVTRSRSGNGSLLATLMGVTSAHKIPGMATGLQAAQQGTLGQVLRVPVRVVAPDKASLGNIISSTVGATADKAAADAGDTTGRSFASHFIRAITLGLGGGTGGARGGGLLTGLLGGIGPGILGLSAKSAGAVGGIGSLLGALPALIGGLSPLLAAAPGLAGLAALVKGNLSSISPLTQLQNQIQSQQAAGLGATAAGRKQIAQEQAQLAAGFAALGGPQKQMFTSITAIQNAWQNLTSSFAPVLAKGLSGVASVFKSLLPDLHSFFAASASLMGPLIGGLGDIARTLLPLFTAGIKAAVPVIRPLLDAIGKLVSGLFPGLIVLVKASLPAVLALGDVFGTLSKDIGSMFAIFAPVLKQSSIILKALFDVIGAIFPIVAKLAAIMAAALAPVFVSFASVVKSLLPVLTIIGKVLASLAGAVLADLVSAFGALAQLLHDVSPSLQILAKTLGQVFTVMENAGVFAILGNALESVVPLLAELVNTLVTGLAPILPAVINLVSTLAGIAVKLLVQAFQILVPIAVQLINDVLRPLIPTILALTPVISALANILGTGLADVLKVVGPILARLAPWILGIAVAAKAWAIAQAVLNIALDANPIGLIALAIAGLGIAIAELVKHWSTVWTTIKQVADDAWHFLDNTFHNKVVQDILDVWSLGLVPLAEHWNTVWNAIKTAADDTWHFLDNTFHNRTVQTLLDVWSLGLVPLAQHWGTVMGELQRVADDLRQWLYNDFAAKVIGLFTNTLPGAFRTAVGAIGRAWDAVQSAVTAPVKFVVNDVLNRLISAFDWISSKVGGPHINPFTFAAGGQVGKVTQGTGPTADDVLALVSKDETILSAAHSRQLAPLLSLLGVPGYARGGKVAKTGQNAPNSGIPGGGVISSIWGGVKTIASIMAALATGNVTALVNDFTKLLGAKTGGAVGDMAALMIDMPRMLILDAVKKLISFGGGFNSSAIVNYAESWLGRIPYVWGGTSIPGGADCSGFTQAVYRHFGIDAPRTSEEQGGWVRKGPPTPGGLAFYVSPAGGPPPGHVAIVRDMLSVISQGGGMGPQLMGLHDMPLMFTGTPPGRGLPDVKVPGNVQSWLLAAMAATGAPANWLRPLEQIQQNETDSLPNMLTVVNPDGDATGLMQVKPGTFAEFATYPGGITNPIANAVAAIRHIMSAWGSPFNIPGIGTPGPYKGYDGGGWLTGWPNMTRKPEAVLTPVQSQAFVGLAGAAESGSFEDMTAWLATLSDQVDELISAVQASAPRTGRALGQALSGVARSAVNDALY